jgi:hypothetical protein
MLGSANRSVYLCAVRSDAPVTSFQEALDREVIIGTSGEGATLREMPIMLINVLGVKLRIIGGYAGSREIIVAMERNEVQGMCGMDWSSLATQQRNWISSGFVRLLAQEDLQGHPEMNRMGVPLTISFAKTPEDRQVMEMIYSQNLFGRPYLVPPGTPPERVAALRRALAAMLQDPALLADAERSGLDIGPMSGEELQALVAKLYALPPRIIERAKQSLIYKPPPARQANANTATSAPRPTIVNVIRDLLADRRRFKQILSHRRISRRLRKLSILRRSFAQIVGVVHLSPHPDLRSDFCLHLAHRSLTPRE